MKLTHAVIAMADISGYTEFIRNREISLLHAEQIIADLLAAVVEGAEHPLVFNKFEGDALLMYAEIDGDAPAVARDTLQQAQRFFACFHAQKETLQQARGHCDCDACANISRLSLKALLHVGEIVIRQWRQHTEIAGEPVILIHRLLKNTVPAREYILYTEAFAQLAGSEAGVAMEEPIEGLDAARFRWIPAPASS